MKIKTDEKKLKSNIFETSAIFEKTTKKDPRIKFVGQCDLLVSTLSYVNHMVKEPYIKTINHNLQHIMPMVLGLNTIDEIEILDGMLDELLTKMKELETKHKFSGLIAIGSTKRSSIVHIARTIARQTELCYLDTIDENPSDTQRYIAQYLNKLSLYLYDVALKYEK